MMNLRLISLDLFEGVTHFTANGTAEMIKETVAHVKTDDLEILFRMDSGYFDENTIEAIESVSCKHLIKFKEYPSLVSQVTAPTILFTKGDEGRETTELITKLDTWDKKTQDLSSRGYWNQKRTGCNYLFWKMMDISTFTM
jgi:hypothetical protein